jgi:Zn-dependent M16 (insulinase) family peptidase
MRSDGLIMLPVLQYFNYCLSAGSVCVQYSEQPTNNITYFQALSGINHLPEELKIYIPLFGAAITQLVI